MAKDRWRTNTKPYTPSQLMARYEGLRPSVKKILDLVDLTDPAWPEIAEILQGMVAAGVELDESVVAAAIAMGRQRHNAIPTLKPVTPLPLRLWGEEGGRESIVYYIRRAKLIKIGTTTMPHQRFEALLPDEILAWEPGGLAEEAQRHAEFRHLRKGQEYFEIGPDLVKHWKTMRKLYGDPPSHWRTFGTLGEPIGPDYGKFRLPPPPVSMDTATATEGAAILGIRPVTVHGWVARKKIRAAGLNDLGRTVYYVDQLRFLAEHSRSRGKSKGWDLAPD